jgi:Tfp pilus assembly protein PilX
MLEPGFAYVVAVTMLLVCGLCALALMRTIERLDPPDARESPGHH